ncbi:uncharacterized protein LOC131642257 [Vicia villosa]|uniref:uncharacterized protein LOC131642257 n=1 Tax=Vicia villosa TaxID=3911 RepID=UPI00273CD43F|nr:uncharacterized protein LOC131642257 [Vicia villosa]
MNHSTQLFLLLLISLIIISHAISPPPNTNLYEVVCNDAEKDHDRCMKLIQDNSEITSAKDYPTLCKAFLRMAGKKSTSAQVEVKNLAGKYPSSNAIKECATVDYFNLIHSFKMIIKEIDEDAKSANYDALVAADDIDICQTKLNNEHTVDPTINSINNDMRFLCRVAFLATDHLDSN